MSDDDAVVVLSDGEESLFENDDGVVNVPPLTVNDDDDFADADDDAPNANAGVTGVAPIIKLDDSDTTRSRSNDAANNVIIVNSTLDDTLAMVAAEATEVVASTHKRATKKAEPAAKKSRGAKSKKNDDSGKAESDTAADDSDSAHDDASDDGWQRKKSKAKRAPRKQAAVAATTNDAAADAGADAAAVVEKPTSKRRPRKIKMLAELTTDLVVAYEPTDIVFAANGRPRRSAAMAGAKKRQRLEETDGVEFDLAEQEEQQQKTPTATSTAKKAATTTSKNALVSPEPNANDDNVKLLLTSSSTVATTAGEKLTPLLVDDSEDAKAADSDDEPLIIPSKKPTIAKPAAATTAATTTTTTTKKNNDTTNTKATTKATTKPSSVNKSKQQKQKKRARNDDDDNDNNNDDDNENDNDNENNDDKDENANNSENDNDNNDRRVVDPDEDIDDKVVLRAKAKTPTTTTMTTMTTTTTSTATNSTNNADQPSSVADSTSTSTSTGRRGGFSSPKFSAKFAVKLAAAKKAATTTTTAAGGDADAKTKPLKAKKQKKAKASDADDNAEDAEDTDDEEDDDDDDDDDSDDDNKPLNASTGITGTTTTTTSTNNDNNECAQPVVRRRMGLGAPVKKPPPVEVEEDTTGVEEFRRLRSRTNKKVEDVDSDSDEKENEEALNLPIFFSVLFQAEDKNQKLVEREGVLQVHPTEMILTNMHGQQAGKQSNITVKGYTRIKVGRREYRLKPHRTMPIGKKLVEIGCVVDAADFTSGRFFISGAAKKDESPRASFERKLALYWQQLGIDPATKGAASAAAATGGVRVNLTGVTAAHRPLLAAARKPTGFATPWKSDAKAKLEKRTEPLHNPLAPNALVLHKPQLFGEDKIAVVVDPVIGDKLRPHQRIGVQFLYDCVMGLKGKGINGALLADDMGLGKTIQTIALAWTLMRQGPRGLPVARKVVIVTPSSLVKNWVKEFNKWLGEGTVSIQYIAANDAKGKANLAKFEYGGELLIISYDQLKIFVPQIEKIRDIGLVVCDEGHRLKNSTIQTSVAVARIPSLRRIVVTGTPIQNDLEEFRAMVDYINPGVLGAPEAFKALFQTPITRGRDKNADDEERELGRARSIELSKITKAFILRRTSKVNEKYLPAKVELTVICKLVDSQIAMYESLAKARLNQQREQKENATAGARDAQALACITLLKKLCAHPQLVADELRQKAADALAAGIELDTSRAQLPKNLDMKRVQLEHSGKCQVLQGIMQHMIESKSGDRVVIVSNYTQTLDMIAKLMEQNKWGYFQLDGSTTVQKRQELVDQFNSGQNLAFLLSSKAGGTGLNLIGANRLVLFDPDWNPANDAQAMARVWRDGQKKRCFIYRLLACGTIEEKIYQRQITKNALSKSIVDGDGADMMGNFTAGELRALFEYQADTLSNTHDLLGCRCSRGKKVMQHLKQNVSVDELSTWDHNNCPEAWTEIDTALSKVPAGRISFVFSKVRDPSQDDPEALLAALNGIDPMAETNEFDESDKEDGATKDAAEAAEGNEDVSIE